MIHFMTGFISLAKIKKYALQLEKKQHFRINKR